MAEIDIQATFNGKPMISLVQGEDRAIAVALHDGNTGEPIDLTSADVNFEFAGSDGQPIRRLSGTQTLPVGSVGIGLDFTLPDHGLVTGDPLTFSGVSLPSPLQPSSTYLAAVIDSDHFSLTDTLGNAIAISTTPVAAFFMSCPDITVTQPPSSGLVTLLLRSSVTQALQEGMGQTFQIEVVINGMRRIALEPNQLDVFSQVVQ